MTTEPDGAPIQDDPPPVLRLRVETLSLPPFQPGSERAPTVEALADAVDDDSGLVTSVDFGGRARAHLVRGVTVVIDTSEPFVFGRRAAASVFLSLDFISLKHALLGSGNDGLALTDNGSVNGTFVNGDAIRRIRLRHGDVVHFEARGNPTRLMFRVLLEERPVIDGACRHDGWIILDGARTVADCHHRAFRRVDAETIETGTAVATGPAERLANLEHVPPPTGFHITVDGAGIPAGRLREMLRSGKAEGDLKAALDSVADTDTVDVDGRVFRWTGNHGVPIALSRSEREAVAAAVAGLLPRLVQQHQALVAELELLGADDLAAVPLFTASVGA